MNFPRTSTVGGGRFEFERKTDSLLLLKVEVENPIDDTRK
jgi:hypothetical protein